MRNNSREEVREVVGKNGAVGELDIAILASDKVVPIQIGTGTTRENTCTTI